MLDPSTGELPVGARLLDGRERCFGKHSTESVLCRTCPEIIKGQCVPQSTNEAPPPPSDKLAALQAKLEGVM